MPATIPQELGKTDIRVSASVLRWPEEMSYQRRALGVWDELLKVQRGDFVLPGRRYFALEAPFLLLNYSRAHSQRMQGKRRARIKEMVVRHNHQEFWKQDEVARVRYYSRVTPDTYRLEPPKGFAPAGVPFVLCFLNALSQASRQNRWVSNPYGMMRSEQAVLAAACWHQECRNRAVFRILPEMLVLHLRAQLTTSFLATGFEEGKALLDDIIRFRLLMPALDGSFQRDVRAQKPERGDGGGWVSVRFNLTPLDDIQLQTALPGQPQLGGTPAPAPAALLSAVPVAQTGWGRLFAPGRPAGRVGPPSPPAPGAAPGLTVRTAPVLQTPPTPRVIMPGPPIPVIPVAAKEVSSPLTPGRSVVDLSRSAPAQVTGA